MFLGAAVRASDVLGSSPGCDLVCIVSDLFLFLGFFKIPSVL